MHTRRSSRTVACLLAGAMSLPAGTAWAGPADELRDLVGARGAGGEAEMERRGYTHIDTGKAGDAAFSYWWSNERRSCIRVTTRDGRYQAVTDVDPSDCGQTRKESGLSDGAKVAIGAAALLGIAALIHKSHDRDDRNYNEQQTADFERGYRDGLYNNGFNGNGGEYNDGYNKGVNERSQQSRYRYGGGNSGGGGYNSSGWTRCASEGEYCRVNGTARVRYGAENRYEYRNVSSGILCSFRLFGDPAYGINKTCEFLSHGSGYESVNYGGNWEYCGSEGGYCSFSGPGDVRYGVNGKFVVRRAINGLPCDVNTFGTDPAYGQNKQCFVRRSGR